jgi:hypothetical protein
VINKPVTWLQANRAAEKMPLPVKVEHPAITGHLVSLHSAAENAFVVEITKGISLFYIGLNDRRLEAGNDPAGPWEWSSGEPVTWRNWAKGEPDHGGNATPEEALTNSTDEDAVVCASSLEADILGKWRDYPTGTSYAKNHRTSYVVEWNLNAAAPVPGTKVYQVEPAK